MTDERIRLSARGTVLAGGVALIGGALAFLGVFTWLAITFDYPDVLDGRAADVLPALLGTGDTGRAVWSLYALLPLIWVPAGVAAFEALRARAVGPMRVALVFASLAAVSMMLGLMRWPSVHWELARAWAGADESQRVALAAVFDGLNRYLGNFVGEFLGELSVGAFFALSGIGLLREARAPRWLGWWGVAAGALCLVAMWRNVTHAVGLVAEVNNYSLPLWMLALGGWLVRRSRGGEVV
jgi:hypothetical protein